MSKFQAGFWYALAASWFIASFACDNKDFDNPSPASITPPVIAATSMNGWEYQLYTIDAPSHEKDGPNALASNEVPIKTAELNLLGTSGWELTTSWVETETAFPLVTTHLMANVRPMRVVLLFKRPLGWKR